MALAMTVASLVLAVAVLTGIVGYLIDRGADPNNGPEKH
jgi:hypothetical protein